MPAAELNAQFLGNWPNHAPQGISRIKRECPHATGKPNRQDRASIFDIKTQRHWQIAFRLPGFQVVDIAFIETLTNVQYAVFDVRGLHGNSFSDAKSKNGKHQNESCIGFGETRDDRCGLFSAEH